MIGFLLNLINPIKVITEQIVSLKKEQIRADNEEKKLDYDERIKVLEARRDSILAAQSDPFERWVRIGFALPFIIYIWKLVVYDKIIMGYWALGFTDNLSSDLWAILWIVLGGYFIDTVAKKFTRR